MAELLEPMVAELPEVPDSPLTPPETGGVLNLTVLPVLAWGAEMGAAEAPLKEYPAIVQKRIFFLLRFLFFRTGKIHLGAFH